MVEVVHNSEDVEEIDESKEDGTIVPSAEEHVVLGITNDSRLTIYCHLQQLQKKVVKKLNALTRIAPYLSYNQRLLI